MIFLANLEQKQAKNSFSGVQNCSGTVYLSLFSYLPFVIPGSSGQSGTKCGEGPINIDEPYILINNLYSPFNIYFLIRQNGRGCKA